MPELEPSSDEPEFATVRRRVFERTVLTLLKQGYSQECAEIIKACTNLRLLIENALDDKLAPGSLELIARGRPDLTVEAIIVHSDHAFPRNVVQKAREKLQIHTGRPIERERTMPTSTIERIQSGLRILAYYMRDPEPREADTGAILWFALLVQREIENCASWAPDKIDNQTTLAYTFCRCGSEAAPLRFSCVPHEWQIPFVTQEDLELGAFYLPFHFDVSQWENEPEEFDSDWVYDRLLDQAKALCRIGEMPENESALRVLSTGIGTGANRNPPRGSKTDLVQRARAEAGEAIWAILGPREKTALVHSQRMVQIRALPSPGLGIVLPIGMAFERHLRILFSEVEKLVPQDSKVPKSEPTLQHMDNKLTAWQTKQEVRQHLSNRGLSLDLICAQIQRVRQLRNQAAHGDDFSATAADFIRRDWLGLDGQQSIFQCFVPSN